MAIKFEKIKAGMVLLDIHTERNTTMRRIGLWRVEIISVNADRRTAIVRWNGNRPQTYYEYQLKRLYLKEPASYKKRKLAERW